MILKTKDKQADKSSCGDHVVLLAGHRVRKSQSIALHRMLASGKVHPVDPFEGTPPWVKAYCASFNPMTLLEDRERMTVAHHAEVFDDV